MPLPETIEKTYLPGDQVDATELNAMQFGITANSARISNLEANELQWIAGKIIGDHTVAPDGVVAVTSSARVLIDCRQSPIEAIRVHCRVDGDGVEFKVMDGSSVLATVNHMGDGVSWQWVTLSLDGFTPGPASRLSLVIDVGQAQVFEVLEIGHIAGM